MDNRIKEKCNDIKNHYGSTNKLVQLLLRHTELEAAIKIAELEAEGVKSYEEDNRQKDN